MRKLGVQALLLAGVALAHATALHCLGTNADPHPADRPDPTAPRPRQPVQSPQPVHYRVITAIATPTSRPQADVQPALNTVAAKGSAVSSTPPMPDTGYLPAHRLDWPALPHSAPDTSLLDGHTLSGLPMTLRLYIDAQGRVTAVHALTLAEEDRPALAALQAMFIATAYSPGRLQGRDVSSTMDLSLGVELAAVDGTPIAAPLTDQHAAAR